MTFYPKKRLICGLNSARYSREKLDIETRVDLKTHTLVPKLTFASAETAWAADIVTILQRIASVWCEHAHAPHYAIKREHGVVGCVSGVRELSHASCIRF